MVSQTQNEAVDGGRELRMSETATSGGDSRSLQAMNPVRLSLGNAGDSYRVVSLDGNEEFATRLAELGFTRGSVVYVLHKVYGGLKVKVNGSEYALGKSALNHIYVVRAS